MEKLGHSAAGKVNSCLDCQALFVCGVALQKIKGAVLEVVLLHHAEDLLCFSDWSGSPVRPELLALLSVPAVQVGAARSLLQLHHSRAQEMRVLRACGTVTCCW